MDCSNAAEIGFTPEPLGEAMREMLQEALKELVSELMPTLLERASERVGEPACRCGRGGRRKPRAKGGSVTRIDAAAVDRATLDAAVPKGLRAVDRPDLLRESPLLAMRLLDGAGADRAKRAERLASVLRETIAIFDRSPRDEVYRRIVERTYLGSPTKQLEVALDLGMAYSTFRRHHALAVHRIAEELWRREREAA
jgi:hypothetical protein